MAYNTYKGNQRLEAFARVDGSGRIVPGSMVLRKKMPSSGKWVALSTYQCCSSTTTPPKI